MRFKILLATMLMTSIVFPQADSTRQSNQRPGTLAQRAAARTLLVNTVILDAYFAPYAFMWGLSLAGGAIARGESPERANLIWAGASIGGMALSWMASSGISNEMQKFLKAGDSEPGTARTKYYRIFSGGLSTASILDFQAKSVVTSSDGESQWTAGAAEVNTASSFPALGRRIGMSNRRWGGEFETSMVAHHTTAQTVFYDASGEIWVPALNATVPLTLSDVDLPDRYLMLHSLFMGANIYVWLPKVKVEPYVGVGAGLLFNSVQSQYPGPANLVQEVGSLALDVTRVGYGLRALLGIRANLSETKFIFAEFRPARFYYAYESGTSYLKENDSFTLQIFEAQIGLGFYIN